MLLVERGAGAFPTSARLETGRYAALLAVGFEKVWNVFQVSYSLKSKSQEHKRGPRGFYTATEASHWVRGVTLGTGSPY